MKLYSYKVRLYPNQSQKAFLCKQFGCCRFVYNKMLDLKISIFKNEGKQLSKFDLIKQLTPLKRMDEFKFLNEVSHAPLMQSVANVDNAFTNFFKHQTKYPKFKSRKARQSFTYYYPSIKDNKYLWVPKHKTWIRFRDGRTIFGKLKSVTISKDCDGTYWASILSEQPVNVPEPSKELGKTVGIDLGLKDFAILSDGTKIPNSRIFEKHLFKIKKIQRHLSRKHKGSKRYEKTRLKLAKLHKRIQYLRNEFIHSFVNRLLRENQTICLENLNVKQMMHKSKLAKSILSVAWTQFVNTLKYKAVWTGKHVLQIERYTLTTRKCCSCGTIVDKFSLSVREWTCPKCLVHHDRDVNAARNILLQAVNLALGRSCPVHSWSDITELNSFGVQVV